MAVEVVTATAQQVEAEKVKAEQLAEVLEQQLAHARQEMETEKMRAEGLRQEVLQTNEKMVQHCGTLGQQLAQATREAEAENERSDALDRQIEELRAEMADANERAAKASIVVQEMQKAQDHESTYSASAHMIEDWQLTLGIEGKEDESARGDASVELAELVSRCGARQAFRMGCVHLPATFSEASPVCVRMAVKNDGASRWPQTTVIVNMEGESLGMQVKELGVLEPGEVREIEMDLEVQSRIVGQAHKRLYRPRHSMPQLGPRSMPDGACSEMRSVWAIVDAATGARLGPLLVFEAMWDLA
jgi:hypothetical protein